MTKYIASAICDACGKSNEVPVYVVKKLIKRKSVQAICYFCDDIFLITNDLIWSKVDVDDDEEEN